jgi:hypothetical protein
MPSPEMAARDFRPLVAQGARRRCGALGNFLCGSILQRAAVLDRAPRKTQFPDFCSYLPRKRDEIASNISSA